MALDKALSPSPLKPLRVLDFWGEGNRFLAPAPLSPFSSSPLVLGLGDPRFTLLFFAFSKKDARSASSFIIMSIIESMTPGSFKF